MMVSLLSSTPWGLHERDSQVFTLIGDRAGSRIPGTCSPRLIVPIEFYPKYGRKNKQLPSVSFPFRWDGKSYASFQLPTDPKPNSGRHDLASIVSVDNISHDIIQADIVGRPTKKHENELGRCVEGFIDWQIHCFRELANDDGIILDELEEKTKRVIRRNWAAVRKVWIGKKADEAIMALIVKLAQDTELLRILENIAKNPRHILFRQRQNTAIDRIQELDSACIRDFAKRPGRTIYEKAGPRQKLLSIQRIESRDTLENRVFTWVLERMIERSWSYIATNKHHLHSNRVELVSRCNRRCLEWQLTEKIKDVSSSHLHHPVQPNYALQMDTRYTRVYKTYKELQREQYVIDDAWEWQRNLWSESARQLMSCACTEFLNEKYTSTPYYRMEGENGKWTETPVAPGPFNTKEGTCFVIDSRDVSRNQTEWIECPPFDFAPYIGSIGCDQVLYWPRNNTLVVVWFVYWTGPESHIPPMVNSAGLALRSLTSDLHRYTRASHRCYGLMLLTEDQSSTLDPGVEVDTWPSTGDSEIIALRIPLNIDQTSSVEFESMIEDFKTGIQLAIDMAC